MRSPTLFPLLEPRETPWTDYDSSMVGEGEGHHIRGSAGAGNGNTIRTCIIMNSANGFSLTSDKLTQKCVRKEKFSILYCINIFLTTVSASKFLTVTQSP